ncbi:cytochrome P450 [Mycena capillaripes]|nr:cytochrome P450 [Mycena capillaripes]
MQKAKPALVGPKGSIAGTFASLRFLWHAKDVLAIGYHLDRSGVFRVPILFSSWFYVASGKRRAQEISSTPENILSFNTALAEAHELICCQGMAMNYTLTPEVVMNPYHGAAIRASLTRNLGRCFPEVRDEIVHAFDDVLGLKDNEWKLVQVLPAILQVVARTSNRLFVGLPLCREPEYLDLNINFATAVFIRGPNDLISWLLDFAMGEERSTPALAMRILTVNHEAIHTSSVTLVSAIYDLRAYPAHIAPMREEAERVVTQEGWTKVALGNMHKIDRPYVRYVHPQSRAFRLSVSSYARVFVPASLGRKVVAKDGFTFSDGTTIPHGAMLVVPSAAMHLDEDFYPQADVFDGFRFSRMREAVPAHRGNDAAGKSEETSPFNRHMVSTGPDHLVFGHGRHACPGFLAATELKAMMAHILINYDIKAETEGVRPPNNVLAFFTSPSRVGKIWIRKRAKGPTDENSRQ